MKQIIYNALIVNEGREYVGYVTIDGQFIAEVGEGIPAAISPDPDTLIIDANGAILLPGAIDTHVHFREPGLTHKSTIASESAAAVAGGVTSFLDMPNTKPATTSVAEIDGKKEIAAATAFANYGFFIGATNDNLPLLLEADYSAIPGIKLFLGSSTGNMLVDNDDSLASLFAGFKGVIAVHAEDEATIAENRRKISEQYGPDAPVTLHSALRSRQACVKASRRAAEMAHRFGTRLHILHISTADELSLLTPGSDISAKRITAETCPHYLIFNEQSLAETNGYLRKCNPAIKTDDDRLALRKAVASDLIDVIATDHAPHLLSEKRGSLFTAASGMPGVKFMLPLLLDMTIDPANSLSLSKIAEKTAHNPAKLYGIDRRGFIRPGYYADLVLAEPAIRNPLKITSQNALTPGAPAAGCDWTPYEGIALRHRILSTWVNGHRVFDGKSVIASERAPMPLAFKQQNR